MDDYGDAGVLVTFAEPDGDARWAAAQALQAGLLAARDVGIVDVLAAFETVFVTFDPAVTDHAGVRELVSRCAGAPVEAGVARTFWIPTVYGGKRGPDLADVARELGLSPDEVVSRHAAATWTVRFRGSPAAAPLMEVRGAGTSVLPASVPRSASPRTRVPAGSVALSGQQCIVYPVASPGGWRLIGQTPLRLVDLTTADLVPYAPGDVVRFVAVGEDDWDRWSGTLADRHDELARAYG